jgi:hypothetical protein
MSTEILENTPDSLKLRSSSIIVFFVVSFVALILGLIVFL